MKNIPALTGMFFCGGDADLSVIARSEATKQSMLQQAEEWIASLRSQ
jgi:hypothetical protein